MKKLHLAFILLLSAVLLPVSCGEKEDIVLALRIDPETVGYEKGQVFVHVASNTSWTLELEDAPSWASVSPKSGSGNVNSVVLRFDANPGSEERSLVLKATAGNGLSVSARLVQQAYTPSSPGGSANGGIAAKASFDWMELPATSASDAYDFLWHTFDLSGRTVRNFSCYWDYSNLVSIWVAYPLSSMYTSGSGYEYAWYDTWADDWQLGIDPLLPRDKQAVLSRSGYSTGNYSPSGMFYARGHQIPRADRKVTHEASDQTCYGINMTPQLNSGSNSSIDFNGGIWSNLENRVRNWASSSDTLYVVTGCVLDGSTYYAVENLGKRVTVPTAYYKAVLRYKKGDTTLGRSGYMGCAVWLEHKSYSKSAKADKTNSMSIDALEEKLGIDLFVNLPAKVGASNAAAIEAENPANVNWWWQ